MSGYTELHVLSAEMIRRAADGDLSSMSAIWEGSVRDYLACCGDFGGGYVEALEAEQAAAAGDWRRNNA